MSKVFEKRIVNGKEEWVEIFIPEQPYVEQNFREDLLSAYKWDEILKKKEKSDDL